MSRILIADDQNDVLEALRVLLKGEGQQRRCGGVAGRSRRTLVLSDRHIDFIKSL